MTPLRQILVVGPAWVGDMVMAQSLFMTLRAQDPGVAIDVLAPAWSLPLLSRMPEVRQGIALPLGHGEFGFGARYRLGRQLKQTGYDQAIVLPRSLKAALVPFFAGIPQRTGYRGEMRYGLLTDIRTLDKQRLSQTVQRFVALALPAASPQPPVILEPGLTMDPVNRHQLLEKFGLTLERPIIGFMPGAEYGPAKRWPEAHFAELARQLLAEGYQVWAFGSQKDRPVAEWIDHQMGGELTNLCGQTSLEEALDLISATAAVVTNDSGLMHVAAALQRPLVAVYGSSTPNYTPPLTRRAEILYRGIECSPCFARSCRLGHTRCLTEISPQDAYDALRRLSASEEIE